MGAKQKAGIRTVTVLFAILVILLSLIWIRPGATPGLARPAGRGTHKRRPTSRPTRPPARGRKRPAADRRRVHFNPIVQVRYIPPEGKGRPLQPIKSAARSLPQPADTQLRINNGIDFGPRAVLLAEPAA